MVMDQGSFINRQDIACARCRERKVRCGRERPKCTNCMNDKSGCDYSVPEKRVNHTKLLCHNFDRLEARLTGIEGELTWLTDRLKADMEAGVSHQRTIDMESTRPKSYESSSSDSSLTGLSPQPTRSKASKHVVRGEDDQGDQYHGPATLLSLSYELKEAFLEKGMIGNDIDEMNTTSEVSVALDGVIKDLSNHRRERKYMDLLQRIIFIASHEPMISFSEPVAIGLPPKQLLLMVLPQFFSHVDYATDIFVESHFAANIERIYSRASAPINDAWAICFNAVVLLALGSKDQARGNDPLMRSQFSLPFFQVILSAFHQAPFLTTPKLINVQALTLLSIVAERYYTTAKSGAIFAQACLLAKLAGLHQWPHSSEDVICQEEAQERYKTFVSLHLRDKTLALSWASICWLPSLGRHWPLQLPSAMFAKTGITARAQLADIQERIYDYFQNETHKPLSKMATEIAGIERSLEAWKSEHGAYALAPSPPHDAELQLTFFAARMLAYDGILDEDHRRIVLKDARASCIILLLSYEKHDEAMLKTLQSLNSPSRSDSGTTDQGSIGTTMSTASAGRLTPLIDAFPINAIFQLTKNILWSKNSNDDSISGIERRPTDLELLKKCYFCITKVNSRTQSQNRASQIEKTLGHLLELIELVQSKDANHAPLSDDLPAPTKIWPATATSMGSTSGEFSASFTPISGDVSWDMLGISVGDPALGRVHDGEREKRKRPRTQGVELNLNDMSTTVPWNLEKQDMWF